MTKADIIEAIYQKIGYSKKDAADLVELIFNTIKDTLAKGEKIKISGFGNFVVRDKKARTGRNPQTGDAIKITARRVLTFKPSQVLRADVNVTDGATPDGSKKADQEMLSMELENSVRIPDRMFFRIGEVADIVGVKAYVLRYWESEFSLLSPNKSNSQQRMYTRTDVENALLIKHLLYDLRFSIEGAKKRISEMRKQGELSEARKVKVVVTEGTIKSIQHAKSELRELIAFCELDH